MRRIEVRTETSPEFELGDTVADIWCGMEETEAREMEKEEQKPGGGSYTLARGGSVKNVCKDSQK